MAAPTIETAAQKAYEAFVQSLGGYAPPAAAVVTWPRLPQLVRDAWIAATSAALNHAIDKLGGK